MSIILEPYITASGYRSEPQPWRADQCQADLQYNGQCCPKLITDATHLLPFQIVSSGAFVSAEITPYGEEAWTAISLTITEYVLTYVNVISYKGNAITALPCGVYEFRLTAGEVWYFEPFTVENFTIDTNAFSHADDLHLIMRFYETDDEWMGCLPSNNDAFLPFMFRTKNATTTPVVYLQDKDKAETLLTAFPLTVSSHDGYNYYSYDGGAFAVLAISPARFKIVDGAFTYYSAPFCSCGGLESGGCYGTATGAYTADSTIITADDTTTVDTI